MSTISDWSREKLIEEIDLLNKKNAELKKTSSNLANTNKLLESSDQQLKAANQQLAASEHQVRQSEEIFKALLDGIEDVIYVSDPDTYELVHVNTVARETWGDDIIGMKCYKALQNRDEPCPFCTNNIIFKESQKSAYVWEFQNEVNKHWYRCSDRAITWPDGRKLRFELASDITELKSNEEKLEKLNINLASKTEELQQILYITTHDLRSPLVNVQGFSKELLSSINELNKIMAHEEIPDEVKNRAALILNEELPESIHYITTSIAKMDNLLMGLLQISRLGRQESSIELLSMNILMQQVADSYKYEIHKGLIEVVIKDLPRCYGDKDQINQLFSNLLGNAIKFLSPERKGKIVISGTEEGKFSRYKIKDNGIGIEKAHQKKIFEMFYKLDPNKPGSGLGMSIIKQIIEKNNGSIQLHSEYGEGTEITINLPVHYKK